MTYAGSPLCGAVNALVNLLDNHDCDTATVPGGAHRAELLRQLRTLTAALRLVHNEAIIAESIGRGVTTREAVTEILGRFPQATGHFAALRETAKRLDRKVDDAMQEHFTAVELLRGLVGLVDMVGLVERVNGSDLQANHRYVDAVAWLKEHE